MEFTLTPYNMEFTLTLVDPKKELIEEWQNLFYCYGAVDFHHGRLEEIKGKDCLINAGNGYGMMDGGVDYAISKYLGPNVQIEVQSYIREFYHGEQPVGSSFVVETHSQEYPYLAHTPTMRAPAIIAGTDAVYRAFRAALLEIRDYNSMMCDLGDGQPIHSVVCMGLGTSCGGVSPKEAARQMFLAYKNLRDPIPEITWKHIKKAHREIEPNLKGGGVLDYLTKEENE